jgi:NitT/TauT family transport system substrate-binding protein
MRSVVVMPGIRKGAKLFAAALALALVATACGSDDPPAAASGGCAVDGELRETTFLLPFPFATPFYPIFVAESLGYYEAEGLKVNIEFADGSASVVQQVVANNVEFGLSDPGPIVDAVALGEEMNVVYVLQNRLIYALVTPQGSPFTSFDSFRGETLGVSEATAGEVPFFEGLLAANGIDPQVDVEIIETGAGATTAAAFDSDRIVAYFSDYFNVIELGFDVALTEFDLGEFGLFQGASIVVQQSLIDDDPDVITCLSRAVARGAEYSHADSGAAIDAIALGFPDQITDPEGFDLLALEESVRRILPYEDSDNRLGWNRPDSWTEYIDLLASRGTLGADFDPESVYTNEFIDDANDFDKQAERDAATGAG